jgi:predicted DNA-binding transcriptional regulator AlpA
MEELLKKRMADLTVLDVMAATNLIESAKSLTIDLETMCKVTGNSKRRVYLLVNNKIYPEDMLVGGYSNRRQSKKLMFYTDKVIEWLKS